MRRLAAQSAVAGSRGISGVAPVLHFAPTAAKTPKDQQVKKNTKIALELVKRFKGAIPATYTRESTTTIDQVEREIETLLGGAEKLRKHSTDDQPMDKLTLMERCLRHGLWSYQKDEGKLDFAQLKKWIVYTPQDEVKFAQLKRELELKEKYDAFRKRRAETGGVDAPLPKINWAQEYSQAVDREVVAEKRFRYDQLAINTTERDEAQIDALVKQYRKPIQEKRLDTLVSLLEQFKPVLAREAIMQRLTIKHLEGQLGIWRYLDWCPEVRDRAELECDVSGFQWWAPCEERRLLQVRLRSKNEVSEIMDKAQSAKVAELEAANPSAKVAAGGDSQRDKLLKEVLALQARLNKRDDEGAAKPAEAKKAHH
jgi:hypothetical protein